MFNKNTLSILSIFFVLSFAACDEKKEKSCGNGRLDPFEMCDPGIAEQAAVCDDECHFISHCGNGLREATEECDDGNLINGDGCSRECIVERGCGNGVIDFTIVDGALHIEQCDDDNVVSGDGCSSDCRLEGGNGVCGNGRLEWPEECDDGARLDGDGCSADCQVESGCGDGNLEPSLEQCDDGNRAHGDGCSAYCRIEYLCGDGVCDEAAGEHCEFCAIDCCPTCGDGVLDGEETCDDGNNVHFDGCSAGCRDEDGVATCGNGIWESPEECDDSNLVNGDGCSDACQREFVIGDQVCESLRGETCRISPADCCPDCGDGVLNAGEECDGQALGGLTCGQLCYDGGTLACTPWCSYDYSGCAGTGPICGDGTAECAEQCDGTDFQGRTCASFGYSEGNLTCSNCTYNISGCSGFLYYAATNFDDSTTLPLGWSMAGSWSIGTPGSGPTAAASPPRCISTSLSGQYANNMAYASNYVRLPAIDLGSANNPALTFNSWIDAESGYDGGRVEVSTDGGTTWNVVPISEVTPAYQEAYDLNWTGAQTTWAPYTVRLNSYIGSVVHLRFAFISDGSVTREGWYIDDIIVTEQ